MIEVELPDGSVAEFPDGTPTDAIQKALSAHTVAAGGGSGQPPAQTPPEGSQPFQRAGGVPGLHPRLDALRAGIAQASIRGALGIKQFFGGLSDEDKAVLREVKAEDLADPNGGFRTAGDVAANVAATSVPGAALAKTLSGARAVQAAGRLAAPLVAAGISGATEALVAPGEGDTFGEQLTSKGKQALQAAAAGGVIQAGGSVLRKALTKPFTPSAEATRLMQEGIIPTLQQGSEGKAGRFIGALTSGAVDVGDRQNKEVMEAFLRRVAPGLNTKDMSTSEIVSHVDEVLRREREALMNGKTFRMDSKSRGEVWKAARGHRGTQPEARAMAMNAMGGTGVAMTTNVPVRMKAGKMQETRDLIQNAIDDFKGDGVIEGQARNNLIAAKRKLDELVRNPALSPEEQVQLKDLDARYSDAVRLFEAAKTPGAQKQLKVADLLRSYAKLSPGNKMSFAKAEGPMLSEVLEPANRVLGMTPNQDEARSTIVALRRIATPAAKLAAGGAGAALVPGAAAPLALGYGTSLLGQTRGGARALMGGFDKQKQLAALMRQTFPYTANLGAAVTDEE